MSELKIKQTLSATYAVDNSNEENREYAIHANVTVRSGAVSNIEAGEVQTLQGDVLANFSVYNGSLSLNFVRAQDSETQISVLNAINSFKDSASTIGTI